MRCNLNNTDVHVHWSTPTAREMASPPSSSLVDVLIVGAGPAGVGAATELQKQGQTQHWALTQ
jgi:ribulose 1,5-bisphosphate synthetase/thiazole synthase